MSASKIPPPPPGRIQPLAPEVVNKIAAGEIIVAPVHALKELLENAIDAGSTRVEVTVKEGGLKLLQIMDNGSGINKDDLPLLCERFTTSKLKQFEDLRSIQTYGFRGEALASISHIAHLTVTTRTASSSGSWRAQYESGKLISEPRLVAGNQGTILTVEDLFYNIPSRRRSFRSGAEELSKIVDLLERYSVHFSGVTILCKKAEARSTVLSVPSSATTTQDRIRVVYGQDVATNILHVQNEHKELAFKLEGWVSNANYTSKKKTVFLLFINHRAVESTTLKRAIEQTYSVFLPKGSRPFVYISLEIPPDRVDVNVHPTKKEVHFLREDEVVEKVCDMVRAALAEVDVSRTFMAQTMLVSGSQQPTIRDGSDPSKSTKPTTPSSSLAASRTPVRTQSLPSGVLAPATPRDGGSSSQNFSPSVRLSSGSRLARPRNDANLVRTDYQSQKITSMFPSIQTPTTPSRFSTSETTVDRRHGLASELEGDENTAKGGTEGTGVGGGTAPPDGPHSATPSLIKTRQRYTPCTLTSVRSLRAEATRNPHEALAEIFAKHTFIGVTDSAARLAVIQSGIRMYVVDYGRIGEQFLYQRGLALFGNFGWITIGRREGGQQGEKRKHDEGGGGNGEWGTVMNDGADADINMEIPADQAGEADTAGADLGHGAARQSSSSSPQTQTSPGLNIDYLLDAGVRYEYVVRGRDPDERFTETDVNWDSIKSEVKRILYSRRDMLKEYFSIEIGVSNGGTSEGKGSRDQRSEDTTAEQEEGIAGEDDDDDGSKKNLTLVTMPVLVKNYFPSLAKLPMFLLRLGRDVNWTEEKPCFESFLRHLAKYYTPESLPIESTGTTSSSSPLSSSTSSPFPPLPEHRNNNNKVADNGSATAHPSQPSSAITPGSSSTQQPGRAPKRDPDSDPCLAARRAQLYESLEKAIFPALKKRFVATAETARMAGAVVEVADLKTMYRTFERC